MRLAAILWLLSLPVFAQKADLVVIHARIYTVNPKQPLASTLAVRSGSIVGVGNDVNGFMGSATQVIDANGTAIIPGLIDSHGHVQALGEFLQTLDLRGLTSESEIAERVRTVARQTQPGEWISGNAWDQNLWSSHQFPDAKSISSAAPHNPVVLNRVDGHAIWVNREAMRIAGLSSATPEPPGGRILRDSAGEPTGVLLDRARSLVEDKIPPPSPKQVEQRIARALRECARLGITTVHDAGVSAADIEAYRSLVHKEEMPIRAYVMIRGADPLLDRWLARGPELGDMLTIRGIKLIADGALGSRGAALLQPYSDDPRNRGLLILDRAAIRSIAEKAIAHGFQLATHAIGDAANHAAIDAYGDVLKGPNDHRFRIEHAQVVAPGDFGKFRRYSVIASMQPTHATSDMPWAASRLGAERLAGAYAWQTFLHLGVHLPAGSDFPVESPDPIPGFYAAITRQDKSGNPPAGWMPTQRMSREEALRSWTIEGAYASFDENRKGSLEIGKLADFIMLSGDIMTLPAAALLNTHVTMTVVNGKVVYRQ